MSPESIELLHAMAALVAELRVEPPEKKYLDIDAYAALLGVPRSWVRDAVTARRLHFTPIGRHARFSKEDIEANRQMWHENPITAPSGVTSIRSRRRRAAA